MGEFKNSERDLILDYLIDTGVIDRPDLSLSAQQRVEQAGQGIRDQKSALAYERTKDLLVNYRTIRYKVDAGLASLLYNVVTEDGQVVLELLKGESRADEDRITAIALRALHERCDHEMVWGKETTERRMKSLLTCDGILKYIETAMKMIRRIPGSGEEYYSILYHTYINPQVTYRGASCGYDNVVGYIWPDERERKSSTSYKRLRKEATLHLSELLFPAVSLKVMSAFVCLDTEIAKKMA